jgi:hypothetical protein
MTLWAGAFQGTPVVQEVSQPEPELAQPAGGSAEFGTVTLDHNLQQVDLQGTYVNPVVILGMLSYKGRHPSTVRAVNVNLNSFQV